VFLREAEGSVILSSRSGPPRPPRLYSSLKETPERAPVVGATGSVRAPHGVRRALGKPMVGWSTTAGRRTHNRRTAVGRASSRRPRRSAAARPGGKDAAGPPPSRVGLGGRVARVLSVRSHEGFKIGYPRRSRRPPGYTCAAFADGSGRMTAVRLTMHSAVELTSAQLGLGSVCCRDLYRPHLDSATSAGDRPGWP
jgi:hypothetical protein